jgi:hypothetical protein
MTCASTPLDLRKATRWCVRELRRGRCPACSNLPSMHKYGTTPWNKGAERRPEGTYPSHVSGSPRPNPAARLRRRLGLMGDQPQPLQSFAVFNKD